MSLTTGVSAGGPAAPVTARLTAVCVVDQLRPDPGVGVTAIDKRVVSGPVRVRELGLHGDVQVDRRFHGGADKALYAYADEAAGAWEAELGYPVAPGLFGENLRTSGLDVDGALIGERWRIGERVRVEVTSPREPCMTFARRLGEKHWVKRFTDRGAPGAYLRVITPGQVSAGDAVQVISRPSHGVSVADWLTRRVDARAVELLAAQAAGETEIPEPLLEHLRSAAARAQ